MHSTAPRTLVRPYSRLVGARLVGALATGVLLATGGAAQTLASRTIEEEDEVANRRALASSPWFAELGLRCATPPASEVPGTFARGVQGDCNTSRTIVAPEYDPVEQVYQIPVVFHVLRRRSGHGNISNEQIQSQIDIFNEDFRAIAGTPGERGTDSLIQFYLADVDPDGNPTTGITRTRNNAYFDDAAPYWDQLAWDTERYLNIYTNSASGALGYVPALPSEGIVGHPADRVVLWWATVGRDAPFGPPFDQGRTGTHELGHYLGLFHTFTGGCSNGDCYSTGDRICDTNREDRPTFGCPTGKSSCGSRDPIRNYMDYSDDTCLTNFSPEQVNRMRCTLANWRPALSRPPCLTATAVVREQPPNMVTFSATPPVLGGTVEFRLYTHCYELGMICGSSAPGWQRFPGGWALIDLSQTVFTIGPLPGLWVEGTLEIPDDPALCGTTIYTQGFAFDADMQGQRLTNAVDLTVGVQLPEEHGE